MPTIKFRAPARAWLVGRETPLWTTVLGLALISAAVYLSVHGPGDVWLRAANIAALSGVGVMLLYFGIGSIVEPARLPDSRSHVLLTRTGGLAFTRAVRRGFLIGFTVAAGGALIVSTANVVWVFRASSYERHDAWAWVFRLVCLVLTVNCALGIIGLHLPVRAEDFGTGLLGWTARLLRRGAWRRWARSGHQPPDG